LYSRYPRYGADFGGVEGGGGVISKQP